MSKILFSLNIFIFYCVPALHAKTIYVNQSAAGSNNGSNWSDGYINLHTALAEAQYGDQVWVTKGVYYAYELGISNTFTLVNGVRLYGGFSGTETSLAQRSISDNLTILSGLATPPFKVSNVVYCENTDSTTLLDGFTIRDGLADIFTGQDCDVTPNQNRCHGGGIYLYSDTPGTYTFLTISNCRIIDNGARWGGGVAANFGYGSGGIWIEKCYFENNGCNISGGALYILTGQAPQHQVRVDSCTFYSNYGYSVSGISIQNINDSIDIQISNSLFQNNGATLSCAGIYISNAGHKKPVIHKCVFMGNEAGDSQFEPGRGGALLGNGYKVSDCLFKENSAYLGGAVAAGNIDIVNCLFENNMATKDGGALWITDRNHLINNTFVGNQANMTGGALYDVGNAWDTIVNCVFVRNKAGQLGDWMASIFGNIYIDHSLIDVEDCAALEEGLNMQYASLTCGENNLFNLDPLFRDTLNGDYRLKGCSPALNHGDSSWVARFGLLTDLSGSPRIIDGLPDIGAYETGAFSGNIQANNISCFGEQDGVAFATAFGGYSPYSYQWNTGLQSPMIDQLSAGNYALVITDTDGCSSISSVLIISPDPFQVSTIITDASGSTSSDGSVSIQDIKGGTPPYSIQWSTGDNDTFQLDSLQSGFYQLSITDSNGCDTIISVEVKSTSAISELFASIWDARISTSLSSSHNRGVTLIVTSTQPRDFKYLLYNSSGHILGDGVFSSGIGVTDIEIPCLAGSGIYFIYICDQDTKFTIMTFIRQ
ncbi:MAG: hypothetical protein IPK76_01275 [Lewinellaceae bacterium]|nr:hypothetical protein [Lewinellaceae bacterium]